MQQKLVHKGDPANNKMNDGLNNSIFGKNKTDSFIFDLDKLKNIAINNVNGEKMLHTEKEKRSKYITLKKKQNNGASNVNVLTNSNQYITSFKSLSPVNPFKKSKFVHELFQNELKNGIFFIFN